MPDLKCRAWAAVDGVPATCERELLLATRRTGPGEDDEITLALPHDGDHQHGPWTWRTGESPARDEAPLPRRSGRGDVHALCREMCALWDALAVALAPGVRPDRSQIRRVPSTRPPLNVEILLLQEQVEKSIRGLSRDLRDALGQANHWQDVPDGLRAMPALWEALPTDHALIGRIPALLAALRDRLRGWLEWDRDWLTLGPCPSQDEPVDVLTRDGLVAADTGCWTLDGRATAEAVARGEDAQVWRRSTLTIARDGDVTSEDVVCHACGYRCTPGDRAADLVLAHGQAIVASARLVAHLLAVPERTMYRWAQSGAITPVSDDRPAQYDALEVARIVVARRAA
ncbi:hypothetical protein [Frankia sp. Cj3]|uniref:hypothetical protein n=1 Tax=Frankia sp. Cj3 TaxID=2880976 RepID=UPI001EF6F0AE|nr:hypothetical protein [Frankia sp. Cj3]